MVSNMNLRGNIMDKCNLYFLEKTVNRFSDDDLNNLQDICDLFDTSLDEICYVLFKELALPVPTCEQIYLFSVIHNLLWCGG